MTKSTKYNCAECGTEVDWSEQQSTSCSKCKENFCSSLNCSCFADRHRKTGCKGTACTITNPKWIVNLLQSQKKETT